jgi:hypothetical protein
MRMIAVVEKDLAKSFACRKPGKLRQVNIGSEPRQDLEPGPNVLNRTLLSTVTACEHSRKKMVVCTVFAELTDKTKCRVDHRSGVFFLVPRWGEGGEGQC